MKKYCIILIHSHTARKKPDFEEVLRVIFNDDDEAMKYVEKRKDSYLSDIGFKISMVILEDEKRERTINTWIVHRVEVPRIQIPIGNL